MKQMTPRNIAHACGGTYFGPESVLDREVTSVTVDSREAKPGCLYVPMRGTRADGHDFIPKAMEAGALLTLTERKEEKPAFPCIRVDSTAEAIQKIAGFYRRALGIPVVGITGSVGKTSTKEMIAAVLSRKYRVLKTAGNFNNNLGLPLTIFRLTEEDDIAVLEMGISHFGEMEKLADTAEPDTMVITNIGECHLEFLGDRDGVFRAKTECFHYMKPDGTVILNGEDDKLSRVAEVNGRKPVFYGCDPKFRVYADRHMVMNALAGAAVGSLYGLTMEEIRDGIESLETLGGRLHQIETKSGYMVIDDCYNANPMSMKASCGILSGAGTRTVAILGDMGELGKDEAALHREVGESVGRLAIDEYVTVGTLSENLAEGIRSVRPSACVRSFAGVEELLPALPGLIQKGDTVLVKASHFMQFERIVKVLTEE